MLANQCMLYMQVTEELEEGRRRYVLQKDKNARIKLVVEDYNQHTNKLEFLKLIAAALLP